MTFEGLSARFDGDHPLVGRELPSTGPVACENNSLKFPVTFLRRFCQEIRPSTEVDNAEIGAHDKDDPELSIGRQAELKPDSSGFAHHVPPPRRPT